ncbi:COQ3.2 family protein [Megaselia abdita]
MKLKQHHISKITRTENHNPISNGVMEGRTTTSHQEMEIVHFNRQAENWWRPNVSLPGLHLMNSVRVPFIRDSLLFDTELVDASKPLEGWTILEVGCGGGILTEEIAKLNANIVGIDLAEDCISAAQNHLVVLENDVRSRITYKAESIEEHLEDNEGKYDAVLISEVIEHIEPQQQEEFLRFCVRCVKHSGSIVITTINKTLSAWLYVILVGEYIRMKIPKGTHHWRQLISPETVGKYLMKANCEVKSVVGYNYNFLNLAYNFIENTNYYFAVHAVRK